MKLLGNLVLIEPLPQKPKSDGGILYAERYRDDRMQWKVLAVGPGRTVRKRGKLDLLIPMEIEVGDHVLSPMHFGNKLAFEDGSGWMIIDAGEIIAKWKE